MMSKLLSSKYPIYCAAMNKVSDAKLASAVWEAGCMPSLSLLNYVIDRKLNYNMLDDEINLFRKLSSTGEFVLSINSSNFIDKQFTEWAIKNNITHIEIIPNFLKLKGTEFEKETEEFFDKLRSASIVYKENNIKLIFKSLTRFLILELEKKYKNLFDGYILKGVDGAGKVVDRLDNSTLLQDQDIILKKYPNCILITSGGITSGSDVAKYLKQGASYIGIGTLFALSNECSISKETKKHILGKTTERFMDTNQNAIIFSKGIDEFDQNHTNSLTLGIKSPDKGHVFVGNAIKTITEIKSVKQIVSELTNEI